MLTEKLLHLISTDIWGMLTRFRTAAWEAGYGREKGNVVPAPRSRSDLPSPPTFPHGQVSARPGAGTCAELLGPQAPCALPLPSPPPSPLHFVRITYL